MTQTNSNTQTVREQMISILRGCKEMMVCGGVLAMYGAKKNTLNFAIENVSVRDFDTAIESLDTLEWVKRDRHFFYFKFDDEVLGNGNTLTVAILCD